jgi:hypothetical protein
MPMPPPAPAPAPAPAPSPLTHVSAASASPALTHVSATPATPAAPTPPPPPPRRRPLRLRVRKAEAGYIADIAAGRKKYEVTQTRYLGASAHGWSLGWPDREPDGQLWVGLSPLGRQPPSGHFLVTHYACLEQHEVLDGVSSWADVAALPGAGVSAAQAAARDGNAKTRLNPARRTYAWHFRAGSVYPLAAPVAIEAFCGPWAETSLRNADAEDMPAAMAARAVLTLVPTKLTKRRRAALASPPPRARARTAAPLGGGGGGGGARLRASPWDSQRTTLALQLMGILRADERAAAARARARAWPTPPLYRTE